MPANLVVVQQFYHELANSNTPGAMDLLADDFRLIQADSLPFGGEYVGRSGITEFFGKFFAFWKSFQSADVTYFAEDDKVVATSTATGTTHDGKVFIMPMVQVYTLRDGKMIETRPFYFDTAQLTR